MDRDALPGWDDILKDPEGWLDIVFEMRKTVEKNAAVAQNKKDRADGLALYHVHTSMRHAGSDTLVLYPYQALGFFDGYAASDSTAGTKMAILDIETLGLCADFGINNPNTGNQIAHWEIGRFFLKLVIDTRYNNVHNDTNLCLRILAILRGCGMGDFEMSWHDDKLSFVGTH